MPSRSRSRTRSPAYRRSRTRSRSRSADRHKRGREAHSRSPMSNRRRHEGNREAPERSNCLGVFGLSLYTTERELEKEFGKFGPLERVQVVLDGHSGRSRGFAFVYYENTEDASEARTALAGTDMDGRKIRVDFSITKRAHTPTPGMYMGRPTGGRGGGDGRGYGGGRGGDRRRDYGGGRDYERGYGGGGGGYGRDERGGGYERRRRSPSPYYRSGGGSRRDYRSRSR